MKFLGDGAMRALRELVSEPTTGALIDERFELRERIGEGGMGTVYAAWDREVEVDVAVKIVRARDDDRERFEREVAALEALNHPAIVRFVTKGAVGVVPYLVMEKLTGTPLSQRLLHGRLRLSEAVALGRRLAEALGAAHRKGLVHRDVKPSNVFLVGDSTSKAMLLDFGIARHLDAHTLTERGAVVGTPGYMAPEQVRGDTTKTSADVFALGCVLFECLTGRPAFLSDATEGVFARILVETPPLVRTLRPETPLPLEGLVEQMLDKDEAIRPSASQIARELKNCEALLPTESSEPSTSPSVVPREGAVIAGKYRLEQRIGEGGMGVVVAARHLELGKRVALKLLRDADAASASRFLREAQAASRLESEHVARVLDVGRMRFGDEDGAPYIVMEYLEGVDLARLLSERGPLDVETAVGYLLEACEAIAEAHLLGIVHRDLKPSNLFLVERRDGVQMLKVLDFGISKLTRPLEGAQAASSMTGTSAVVGSVGYMSPEQLQNSKSVDVRTDIWALGVVLYELVSGARPFDGQNAAAVGARIAASEPRPLRDVAPGVPRELEAVIMRCLAKKRGERISNVALLARELEPFAASERRDSVRRVERLLGTTPRLSQEEPAPRSSRGRTVLALTLLVAALFASALTAVVMRSRSDAREDATATSTSTAPAPAASSVARPALAPEPSAQPVLESTSAPAPSAMEAKAASRASSVVAHSKTASPSASSAPVVPVKAPSKAAAKSDLDLHDPALEGR